MYNLLTFQLDALVILRAKVKRGAKMVTSALHHVHMEPRLRAKVKRGAKMMAIYRRGSTRAWCGAEDD